MWRLSLLALWTAAVSLAWGLGALGTCWSSSLGNRWRAAVFRGWARGALWILAVRVRHWGEPPAELPHILVANHLGYLDVIVLAAAKNHTVFVAKSEVRRWPLWGILARAMGTVFVDRDRARDALRVARAMSGAWERGSGMVIFPEGTSTPGDRVEFFRTALLEPAAAEGWPIHYAALAYATGLGDPPAATSVCWWGDMEFMPHLWNLAGLGSIEAIVRFGDAPLAGRDRKLLGRELRLAVDELRQENWDQ